MSIGIGELVVGGIAALVSAGFLIRAHDAKIAADREFQHNLEYLLWLESRLHHAGVDGCDDDLRECLRREMSRVSRHLAARQVDEWRRSGRRASQHP